MEGIRSSFTPEPITVVINSVVDTKGWMKEQTPALHDHLKAHQFKFERNASGECRMFYKEWSSDTFWLPETGLVLLPHGKPVPSITPKVLLPSFDPDNVAKVQATIRKIAAYLDKAGVASWWSSWLGEAQKYTQSAEPQPMEG